MAGCGRSATSRTTWEAESSGALSSPTSGMLSGAGNWPSPSCPVQEAFASWPANFTPVGYDAATDAAQVFTASDGRSGQPYLLLGAPPLTTATHAGKATLALAPSTGGQVPAMFDGTDLRAQSVRTERVGDWYALHHTAVHSVTAEAGTLSLVLRGLAVKPSFRIIDTDRTSSFTVRGAANETPTERAAKRMNADRLVKVVARIDAFPPELKGSAMADDLVQGLLFGLSHDVVDADVATREVRVLGLNVQGAPSARRGDLLEWLYASMCNVLVLTEVRINDSGDRLAEELEGSGFQVARQAPGSDDRYRALIATKGYQVRSVQLAFSTPRMVGARLATHLGPLDVVALYSVTNGMSPDSSATRQAFQDRAAEALRIRIDAEPDVPVLLAGDLNILEPGGSPACADLFQEHDYAFYRRLAGLGLVDAYRLLNPGGIDQSWYGPHGGQRLDHTMVSAALADRIGACGFAHDVRVRGISDHSAMTTVLA